MFVPRCSTSRSNPDIHMHDSIGVYNRSEWLQLTTSGRVSNLLKVVVGLVGQLKLGSGPQLLKALHVHICMLSAGVTLAPRPMFVWHCVISTAKCTKLYNVQFDWSVPAFPILAACRPLPALPSDIIRPKPIPIPLLPNPVPPLFWLPHSK